MLLVLLLRFAGALHAQAPAATDTSLIFSVRSYSIGDGLPHRRVNSVAQDDAGSIWAATPGGLVRFDGYTFRILTRNEGLSSDNVRRVLRDADGLLWVQHEQGAVDILDPLTGRCAPFAVHFEGRLAPGMTADVSNMAASNAGLVVVVQGDRLFRYASYAGGFTPVPAECGAAFMVDAVEEDGGVWCRCMTRTGEWAGNELLHISGAGAVKRYPDIVDVSIVGHDRLDPGVEEGKGLHVFDRLGNEGWISPPGVYRTVTTQADRSTLPESERNSVLRAPLGSDLWMVNTRVVRMGTGESPYRGRVLFDIGAGSEGAFRASDVLRDRLGHIWLATEFGLYKVGLRADRFQRWLYEPEASLGLGRRVRGMAVVNDRLHVNTESEGYWVLDVRDGHVLHADTPLHTARFAVVADGQGGIWRSNGGEVVHEGEGVIAKAFAHACLDHTLWSLLPLADTTVLIGGQNGWHTEREARETPVNVQQREAQLYREVWFLGRDRAGRVLACTSTGLYRLDETSRELEHWWSGADRTHDASHYLPTDDIRHFHQDTSGIFWLATATRGLLRWDPRSGASLIIGPAEGMPVASIHGIEADDQGLLWMSTDNGLVRYDPSTGLVRTYTTADGIAGDEFNRIAHTQGPDGRIYFGGQNGITVVDPRRLRMATASLEVPFVLQAVHVQEEDGSSLAERTAEVLAGAPITMRPRDRFFTVDMVLLGFDDPALVRYAWRIDGIDADWNIQREPHLRSTSLPYGEHTLRIKALGADGQWNARELALPIVMVPPLYLRWWFITACVLVVAALVYAFIRYRVSRVKELLRMRDRIALDLHDEVGSDLSSIVLFSTVVGRTSAGLSEESSSMLARIAQNSQRAMERMNDIVWSVNPGNDAVGSLFDRMRAYAEPLCEAAGIEPVWDVPRDLLLRKLRMDDRKNLYLIFKEALNNAVKHAQATRVVTHLKEVDGALELVIEDNGIGLPREERAMTLGGNGLKSMRKRATELGGELELRPAGQGTRLVLRFKPRVG